MSYNERVLSIRKHILGDKRTRLRCKRQREQVSIYTNSRVLKESKKKLYTDYGPVVASGSDDSDSDQGAGP